MFDNGLSINDLDYLCHLGVRNLQESNEILKTNYQATRNIQCAFIEYCWENDGIEPPDGYPSLRNEAYLFFRYRHEAKGYVENELGISEYRCVKESGEFSLYDCLNCGEHQLVYDANTHRYHCFSCDQNYTDEQISFCERCGSIMLQDDAVDICPVCIENMSKE